MVPYATLLEYGFFSCVRCKEEKADYGFWTVKAKLLNGWGKVTFNDVAGVEEAKEEVEEIVEF